MKNHRFNFAYICIFTFLPLISFAQKVGIGTTFPTSRLHVNGDTFATSPIIYARNNYVGMTDVSGIEGYSVTSTGRGYGVEGTGGKMGVYGTGNGTTSFGYTFGVFGSANGPNGTRVGVHGSAIDFAALNVGVWGHAENATTNWAGYFQGRGYFDGNVGIGALQPMEKLTVLSADNTSFTTISSFYANNQSQGIGIGLDEIRKIGATVNSDLKINAKGTGNLILQNTSTGNVGIGNPSPTSLLSLQSNNSGQTALEIKNISAGGQSYILHTVGSGVAGRIGNLEIWRAGFGTNMLTIQPEGNFGIQTTAPNSQLHLNNSQNIGPQITLSAPGGGTPGIAFRPYQPPSDWGNPAQALISATDNNYSANINFLTKMPGGPLGALIQRMTIQNDGNVGIGSTAPEFKLSLDNDGGILAKGIYGSGATLSTNGAGTRMIWYPRKAAFRAGYVAGTQWDDVNIGAFSFASGYGSKASGYTSTAMGEQTIASGSTSIALGNGSQASGYTSTAMGQQAIASGSVSTAIGYFTTASGYHSTAIGDYTFASGDNSTAIGNYISTFLFSGSFAIGDNSSLTVMNSNAANEFSARFAGGYRLFSNSALTAGVTLAAGAGAWASVSDMLKKENFLTLNAEDALLKIKNIPVTEWNYKAQDKTIRHLGPMAQDFYKEFGLGGIGNDTTITTTDIDGVNMLGIQALEMRTTELKIIMQEQQVMIEELKNQVALLISHIQVLEKKKYAFN